MPRTKTPNLTNAEWILIMSACEYKKKSPAVVGDKKFLGHLLQIIIDIGAQVGAMPGVIDPAACQIENVLDEADWVEVYYALEWMANPASKKFIKNKYARKSGPECTALMEKIGPDGDKMYG